MACYFYVNVGTKPPGVYGSLPLGCRIDNEPGTNQRALDRRTDLTNAAPQIQS